MRVVLLGLSICLLCVSQAPVVVAGTRAVVEEPARVEDELCRGWNGNWYRQGASECLPPGAAVQSPAPTETMHTQEEADAAQASERSGSPNQLLFLVVVLAVIVLAAAAIRALRTSRRGSPLDAAPEAHLPDRAPPSQPDQPATEHAVLPVASEDISTAPPPPAESEDVVDQPALADGEAVLVTVWTGAPCTVEFTWTDEDGDRHRNPVDITRIMRDPRDGGWHLHGFCHLWREERDYDGASIVTKILYKSRRWNLEDWISAMTDKEAPGS